MRRDLYDIGSRSTYSLLDIIFAVAIALLLAVVLLDGLDALFL